MTLRTVAKTTREVRLRWYALRAQPPSVTPPLDIGATTSEMWAAERALAGQAARWREVLAARDALPVAERWSLAALEKWAQAQGDTQ